MREYKWKSYERGGIYVNCPIRGKDRICYIKKNVEGSGDPDPFRTEFHYGHVPVQTLKVILRKLREANLSGELKC